MARKQEFSAIDLALAALGGAVIGAVGMALVDRGTVKPAGQISPAG